MSRSQADNAEGKSIADSLVSEQEFFAASRFAPVRSQTGTRNLALRCNGLLAEHIRAALPDVRRQLADMEREARDTLERYGDGVPGAGSDTAAQGWYLMHCLNAYAKQFADSLEGDGQNIFAQTVAGGARLRQVFNDSFGNAIDRARPVDSFSDDMLRSALRNAAGASNSLFVPQRAFEALARRAIGELRPVARQCVADAAAALRIIAGNAASNESTLARHAALRRRIDEATIDLIDAKAAGALCLCRLVSACAHENRRCHSFDR